MKKKTISKILLCAMLISVLPKTNFAKEDKVNSLTIEENKIDENEAAENNGEIEKKLDKEEKRESKQKENLVKPEGTTSSKVEIKANI